MGLDGESGSGLAGGPRRRACVVLVAALAALAGCGGGSGTVDRTPYDVPERGPFAGEQFPPGVSESGVENPFSVAEGHALTLKGRSYRAVRNRTLVAANGTVLRSRNVTLSVREDRTEFTAVERRLTGDRVVRRAFYGNGDRVIRARSDGDGPLTFSTVDPTGNGTVTPDDVLVADPPFRSVIYRYASAVDDATVWKVADRAVGEGSNTYRIEVRSFRDGRLLHPRVEGDLEGASLTMTVTDRGLVTGVELRCTIRRDGRRLALTDSIRVAGVDDTVVWAPEWIEAAREALDAEEDGDRK